MRLLGVLMMLLAMCGNAEAYSYAAAGKEPLLDTREAILKAVNDGDWQEAAAAYGAVRDEIVYLDEEHDPGLLKVFDEAIAAKAEPMAADALKRAFITEILRRLEGGFEQIQDYQTAKGLVVKSKRFLDAMGAEVSPQARAAAEEGLSDCLAAIGNPGVFGVGQRAAEPEAYRAGLEKVKQAFGR